MEEAQELGSFSDKPTGKCRILHVPHEVVPDIWPRVGGMFGVFDDKEPRYLTRMDVFGLIMRSAMQLHLSHDGDRFHLAGVTELTAYPQALACRIVLISGEDMKPALPLIEAINDWGKEQGATYLEVIGRPGWEKLMKPYGFLKHSVCLFRRIE